MATQKRRVIYFADDEWEALTARAARNGMTISAYLRLAAHEVAPDLVPLNRPAERNPSHEFRPVPKPSQRK